MEKSVAVWDLRLPEGKGLSSCNCSARWILEKYLGLRYDGTCSKRFGVKGIATWNIEFRRVGDEGGGWPGTLIDAANATDYLQQIAEENHLDLGRVIAIGHSAGGHLVLWLAGRETTGK